MAKPAVNVVITGDTKGLEKSLKKSSGALGDFGSTALGVFGGMALTAGVGLLIDGVKNLASFALDGVDKLDALGDSTARLDALAKGLGDTAAAADLSRFGVDKNEQTQSALAIAKVGKSLGLTDKQLGKVTPNLQEMAAQLASLGDGDPEKQAQLLSKALGGSAKAAKELGVQLPKGGSALDNYRAVMAQLGPQLDEATSGQASLADVGERWDATLANLQLQLAGFLEQLAPVVTMLLDNLLPALGQLVDVVGPMVAAVFTSITEAISGFLEGGGAGEVAAVFSTVSEVFAKLVGFVQANVIPVFIALAEALAENLAPLLPVVGELLAALGEAFDALLPVLETLWSFIASSIVPILADGLFPILGSIIGIILKLATLVIRNLVPAIRKMGEVFADVLQFLRPVFEMLGSIAGAAGDALGAISGVIGGIGKAGPQLAGAPGAVGYATGSVSITVQAGVGDPVAIGRTVARYLGAYTGRGGSFAT